MFHFAPSEVVFIFLSFVAAMAEPRPSVVYNLFNDSDSDSDFGGFDQHEVPSDVEEQI